MVQFGRTRQTRLLERGRGRVFRLTGEEMTEVQLHGVSKNYPGGRGVVDLNWRLRAGALTVLVGASGSGKTTTLRLLAGLESPSSGKICFDGKDQTSLAPHQREVALVPQSPGLFPQWTVRQNMQAGMAAQRDALARQVSDVARLLEIETLLERYPGEISGGEQQRVSLGRALVRRPRLLLLDEPLGQLDGWLRHEVRRKLRAFQRESQVTTLLVTHDPDEALSLADELAVIDAGRLLQSATAAEIVRQPAHIQVAKLFGRGGLNLWRGSLVEENGSRWFATTGWRWLLPVGVAAASGTRDVWLGLPADDLVIGRPGEFSSSECWSLGRGVITDQEEPWGERRLISVLMDGEKTECRVAVARNVGWKLGEEVGMTVQPAAVHWFDGDGWRLQNV